MPAGTPSRPPGRARAGRGRRWRPAVPAVALARSRPAAAARDRSGSGPGCGCQSPSAAQMVVRPEPRVLWPSSFLPRRSATKPATIPRRADAGRPRRWSRRRSRAGADDGPDIARRQGRRSLPNGHGEARPGQVRIRSLRDGDRGAVTRARAVKPEISMTGEHGIGCGTSWTCEPFRPLICQDVRERPPWRAVRSAARTGRSPPVASDCVLS